MPVSLCQLYVSSTEFTNWVAYELIEPGEPYRSDYRNAMICYMIANAFKGKGKKINFEDFMPKFSVKSERRICNDKEIKTKLLLWKSSYEKSLKNGK